MATTQEMYDAYVAAEQAVLTGQEYEIAGRRLKRADLAEIRAGREDWGRKLANEQASAAGAPRIGGLRFSQATFN